MVFLLVRSAFLKLQLGVLLQHTLIIRMSTTKQFVMNQAKWSTYLKMNGTNSDKENSLLKSEGQWILNRCFIIHIEELLWSQYIWIFIGNMDILCPKNIRIITP